MAITACAIIQDNIISGKALLSVCNPLTFIIQCTYVMPPPDFISVTIKRADNQIMFEGIAPVYSDVSAGVRQYIFVADQILRGMITTEKSLEDVIIPAYPTAGYNALIDYCYYFNIIFTAGSFTDSTTFFGLYGSNQFGSSPCEVDLYDEADATFIAYKDYPVYLYYFDYDDGLHKMKVVYTFTGINQLSRTPTHSMGTQILYSDVRDFCTGQILIKYLDNKGMYRFYAFNKFYETKINNKEIGRASRIITNILTDKGSSSTLGYKTDKTISLVADGVSNSDLTLLESLYTSLFVYMYIGNGTDTESSWILMNVVNKDFISRIRKGNSSKVELILTYPETFNPTKL